MTNKRGQIAVVVMLSAVWAAAVAGATAETLPAWNSGAAKSAILTFVAEVTDPESDHYVTANDRVAVFDNDGTLWAEQPLFFQFEFVLHRIRQLAPKHPEWRDQTTTPSEKTSIEILNTIKL